MEIVWTKKARETFEKNVDYLLIYWNEKQAVEFINESIRTIGIVQKNPQIGAYNEDYSSNIILIVKQISLFYVVKKDKIILKNFWDNRQKPISNLKF